MKRKQSHPGEWMPRLEALLDALVRGRKLRQAVIAVESMDRSFRW